MFLLDFQATYASKSSAVNSGYDGGGGTSNDIELGQKAEEYSSMKLNFITGTILAEKLIGFERWERQNLLDMTTDHLSLI